jgi:TRAP-type C4-dicarboxylate transport system substrate-binding protein
MKNQNFIFLFLYPLILLLTFLFFPQKNIFVSASANTKFRCASIAPPGSLFEKIFQEGAQKIKERTGVEVIMFSGSIVGDEIDIARDLKNGKYDCAILTVNGLGFISSYFRILDLPFMIKNEKESDLVRRKLLKAFRELIKSDGYVLAGIIEIGFGHFFSKYPMQSLKDFAGKSFWVWKIHKINEEIYARVLKNLGAKSVETPTIWDVEKVGDKIDILIATPYVILALGWTRFTKYIVEPNIGYLPAGIIIKKDKVDSLPQEVQNEMERIVEALAEEATLKIRKENEEAKKFLINKLGFQITTIKDAEELEKLFREYMWPVFKEKYIPSWFFISVMTEILKLRTGQ